MGRRIKLKFTKFINIIKIANFIKINPSFKPKNIKSRVTLFAGIEPVLIILNDIYPQSSFWVVEIFPFPDFNIFQASYSLWL